MNHIILPDASPLDTLRPGSYTVKNPDSGLDPGTYLIIVIGARTASGLPLNQQLAYRQDDGAEFFRANLSVSTADWTPWSPRSGSGSDITASAIIGKLDAYFASTAWRDGTNLAVINRDADSLDIESSTGDDVTLPSATFDEAGLLGTEDKSAIHRLNLEAMEPIPYRALEAVEHPRIVVVVDTADGAKVRHLNPADPSDADRMIGKTLNSAATGEVVNVKILSTP
jgi:hypothetical protein